MNEQDILLHGIGALLKIASTGQLPITMTYLRGLDIEFHFAPGGNFLAVRLPHSELPMVIRAQIVTDDPHIFATLKIPPAPPYDTGE